MRQPLEDRVINISRARFTVEYPAGFMLVASMNPCPCGRYGFDDDCTCSENNRHRYIHKISGPLLDRIDLHVRVARPAYGDLVASTGAETSATIRDRVLKARARQAARLSAYDCYCNAHMGHREIKETCCLSPPARDMLREAFDLLRLSARSYDRLIKVAQTIADLSDAEQIEERHVAEAISYRNKM